MKRNRLPHTKGEDDASAAAKSWANAWPTTYRFQNAPSICVFGCGLSCPDKLTHYRQCTVLWKHIFANWPSSRPYPANRLGISRFRGQEKDALATLYVAYSMYNSARNTRWLVNIVNSARDSQTSISPEDQENISDLLSELAKQHFSNSDLCTFKNLRRRSQVGQRRLRPSPSGVHPLASPGAAPGAVSPPSSSLVVSPAHAGASPAARRVRFGAPPGRNSSSRSSSSSSGSEVEIAYVPAPLSEDGVSRARPCHSEPSRAARRG